MFALKQKIFSKDNNYSKIEKNFKKKTKNNLLNTNEKSIKNPNKKITIIIPAYNSYKKIKLTFDSLKKQTYKNFEIILVDDGSPKSLKKIIKKNEKLKITYIRNQTNKGISYSRNMGMLFAKDENIIFLDSDLVVPRNFVYNVALRLENTNKCLFIIFKENINFRKWKNIKRIASIKADWRYYVKINHLKNDFIPINLDKKKNKIKKEIKILKETNYLKKLGKGKSIGYWDLPSMIIGHGIACKKSEAISCGGFPEKFTGWGMEDIAFGAAMIAKGNYIIPLLNCTSFHINHRKNLKKRRKELKNNIKIYFKHVNKKRNKFPAFPKINKNNLKYMTSNEKN